jgi:hypothetical protein
MGGNDINACREKKVRGKYTQLTDSHFFEANALIVAHRSRTFLGRNGEIGVACGGRSRDAREGGANGIECSARAG